MMYGIMITVNTLLLSYFIVNEHHYVHTMTHTYMYTNILYKRVGPQVVSKLVMALP